MDSVEGVDTVGRKTRYQPGQLLPGVFLKGEYPYTAAGGIQMALDPADSYGVPPCLQVIVRCYDGYTQTAPPLNPQHTLISRQPQGAHLSPGYLHGNLCEICRGVPMKITILGSGTSTGIPMVGCKCPVCTSSDPRDSRTRASLLVEHGGRYILVDTSTDLRIQAVRAGIPRIDAVLFTHAHADHVHGIDEMRGFHFHQREVIPCYASRETLTELLGKFDYIFNGRYAHGYHKIMEPHEIAAPFELFGLGITPIPLLHGNMPATGFRFGPLAYLTDCNRVPEGSMELLKGTEILIIDGLRHTPHPHHFNIREAIDMATEISPRETYITHLTHEVSHSEEADLPAGIHFAYDGLSFTI